MFQFICNPCADAGDLPYRMEELKRVMHAKCRGGTWCDCQHVVTES